MNKAIFTAFVAGALILFVCAAGYETLVYKTDGGNKMVVVSGGEVEIQTGGTLDLQSGAALTLVSSAPSAATDTGTIGEIRIAGAHVYFCTATDTWGRLTPATW